MTGHASFILDRILVEDMDEFIHESISVKKHIPCKYHKEMSCQSVVVRKNIEGG